MIPELRHCLNNCLNSSAANAPSVTATPPVPSPAGAARSPLSHSLPARLYQIVAIDGDDAIAQRLLACGLWAGATIERLTQAPFGDPLLFRVHGFRLALRTSEAARVQVVEAAA